MEKMIDYYADSLSNFSGTSLAAQNLNEMKKANIFSENGKQFWFEVFIYGGKKGTGLDVIDWSKKM